MLFWPFKVAFKLISLFVSAVVVFVIVSAVQVLIAAQQTPSVSSVGPASAIVLLGAPAPGGTPGPTLLARLQTASQLYAAHLAPRIVVTGFGSTSKSGSVVAAERSWLTSNGVPSTAISTVDASDAAAGLRGAAAMLGKSSSAIVVTDAIDALWTGSAASQAGLAPRVVAASGSKGGIDTKIGPILRQATGVAASRIVGALHVPWAAT